MNKQYIMRKYLVLQLEGFVVASTLVHEFGFLKRLLSLTYILVRSATMT